jgi:1,4-alpha-glucan branching enzyme
VRVTETPVVPATFAEPFTFIDSNATSVAVVGSFNGWDSTKNVLTRSADGVWSTTIMLAPGRYEYQLMVDGKLITDPTAQQTAESEFGAANSVLIVTAR